MGSDARRQSGRPSSRRRRRRVLIVDDEYLIAQDLAEAAGEAGFEVLGPATGLRDALRLLREGGADAAVIDLNLGTAEEGVLLAEELAAQLCPFLVFSGDSPACARLRVRFPRVPMVEKPAPRHEIRSAMARLSRSLTG